MKKEQHAMYIAIILIAISTIIYLILSDKKSKDNSDTVSIDLLDKLINNSLNSLDYEYANYIHSLTEYCIKNDTKDSVNKFVYLCVSSLMEDTDILEKLNSTNKRERIYTYKFLEFLRLADLEKSHQFDDFQVGMFSNLLFENDTLNLGDDFKCYIGLGVNSFYNPIRIRIEGEKDIIVTEDVWTKYTRPSTTKGDKELKGMLYFRLNGIEDSLHFLQKYTVK